MNRITLLQKEITKQNISALIITNPINIFYLTGFKGDLVERESILLIDSQKALLIIPEMYFGQILPSNKFKKIIPPPQTGLFGTLIQQISKYPSKIAFEPDNLTYQEYTFLKKKIKKITPIGNTIQTLRLVKDKNELNNIQKAANIADKAFSQIIKYIKPGVTEQQLSKKLLQLMEKFGSNGPSFATIIASGANSAIPHHLTSDKKIKNNEPILFDFGATVNGYCSDMSRTVYLGKPPAKFINIYNLVLKAQENAIKKIRLGITAQNIHKSVTDIFGPKSRYFIHGTGHGVGLEIHEKPFLRDGIEDKLVENMVVTVEPGLYFQNEFGIRTEDLGVVTKSGFKTFSKSPKKLLIISS